MYLYFKKLKVKIEGVDCSPGQWAGSGTNGASGREAAREAEEMRGTSSISLLSAPNQLNQTA